MFKIYDKSKIDFENLPFKNKDLWVLLVPIVIEQLLNSFMGMADSMMVARVGNEAISAVSLVDSVNVLIIQVFAALATGAAIICSQYVGMQKKDRCIQAARQITLTVFAIAIGIAIPAFIFNRPLLSFIFGQVDESVMNACVTYFYLSVLSYPFIALFSAGSAFFRAAGNSKLPMRISVISNVMNIVGNAIFIFGFNMGVFGAGLATLISRFFCFVVVYYRLRNQNQMIYVRNYFSIKPDWKMIGTILAIGIPSGIENGMFQFGKLAIQSTVSTLGTKAIAAQAMASMFENVNGIGACGVGIGLMTVVGQCIGAGKKEEAKYYVVKHAIIAEVVVTLSCLFVLFIAKPVLILANYDAETIAICLECMIFYTIIKPFAWVPSFIPSYGLKASGDIKFNMIVATCTMWTCRVTIATILMRYCGFGPMGVWVGMATDWTVRGIIFGHRFLSGKWLEHAKMV